MTDDQTPGVAAMRDEIDLSEPYRDDMYRLLEKFWDAARNGDWDGFVERDIRRLAAGPTLADVLALKASVLDAVDRALPPYIYKQSTRGRLAHVVAREFDQALTALWSDGEHRAVCPTCNGNGVLSDMQIEGSRGARERTVDCPTCATARPHQADPQEAM